MASYRFGKLLNVLSLTVTASCGEYKNDLRPCSTVNTESANVFSLWATAGAVNQKAIQLKMCTRPNFTLACGSDCVTHWQELNFTISATTSVRLGNLIHPKGASYPFGLSRYFCLENVSLSFCGTRAQLADRPRCQCGRLEQNPFRPSQTIIHISLRELLHTNVREIVFVSKSSHGEDIIDASYGFSTKALHGQ